MNYTWNNTGANWNANGSWDSSPDGFPSTNSDAAFFMTSATTNPNINSSVTIGRISLTTSTGGYTISAGAGQTLTLMGTGATSTAALNVSPASGSLEVSASVVLGAASGTQSFNVTNATGILTVSGALSSTNPVTLNKSGAGLLVLSNASNSYTGGTLLTGGTLRFASGALGSGNVTFAGGTLQYASGNTQDISSRIANSASAINLDLNGNNVTYSSTIGSSNTGGLALTGSAGTLTLSAANSYSGTTTLSSGGTIILGHKSALGTGALLVNTANGTLSANANLSGTNRITNAVSLAANLTLGTGSPIDLGGDINLNGSRKVITNATGDASTFSGVIGNSSNGFGLITTNDIILTGSNTFLGGVDWRGSGALVVSNIGNSGVAGNLGAGTYIQFGGNNTTAANLRYTGAGETTDREIRLGTTTGGISIEQAGTGLLRFSGSIATTAAGAKTLTLLGASGTGQLDGNIQDNGGALSVAKNGTGTWILAGSNTYTGATTVNLGTLVINGSVTSAVTVNTGATLSGTGTIVGSVVTGSGSVLSPGNSPGTLNVSGNLTLGNYTSMTFELGDVVAVSGDLTLGTNFTLNALSDLGLGNYDLFTYTGSLVNPTSFAGWTATGLTNGYEFLSDGNSVYLSVVPEPGTYALLGLGVGALLSRLGGRRRG